MVHICRLLVLMGMLLCLSAQFASSQHWSHGWYPGGKREIDIYDTSEVCEYYLRKYKTVRKAWTCDVVMCHTMSNSSFFL